MKALDKSNMINFCVDAAKLYGEAAKLSEKINASYPKPSNIVVAGMGGSGIGGELLKDWLRNKIDVPVEVNRDYNLPAYAGKKTLVLLSSYSGDTEETLSAFLDALKRKCMVFCVGSGGALLENTERLGIPFLRVPSGMPPRAALPYLFVPSLLFMEKIGLAEGAFSELTETLKLLEKISDENSPQKPTAHNFCKALALNIGQKTPVTYGFGFYRSVAMRFKQQFNENSKAPAKWEVFSELNHNEIVGWEGTNSTSKNFYTIFIRDKNEPVEIRSRIEVTKEIMKQAGLEIQEVQVQGKSTLARMLSTVCIGDFASIYLAYLNEVDPTPVKTINLLKETLKQTGVKKKVLAELSKQR